MTTTATSATATKSLAGEYAGFVTRSIAFMIDILVVNLTVLAIAGVGILIFGFFGSFLPWAHEGRIGPVSTWIIGIMATASLVVMMWIYPTVFWMINGQTVGKRIMGLRVVRMNGSEMTFWLGLVRVFGYLISALPFFLGYIWVLFSDERRGWHDKMAGTCVIYAWDARGSAAMRSRLAGVRDSRSEP